jgi:hypothetical protein
LAKSAGVMDVVERVFDDDEKQRAWLEGCRREEAISGLLERHGDKRLSIKDGRQDRFVRDGARPWRRDFARRRPNLPICRHASDQRL